MKDLLGSAKELLQKFYKEVTEVKSSYLSTLQQTEVAIPVCVEYLRQLKVLLRKYRTLPRHLEISFFKEIKPRFVSEYLFNVLVYRLHYDWPVGTVKKQQLYLDQVLTQVGLYFEKHHQFYCYHRKNCSHLDNIYFVRWQQDSDPTTDQIFSGTDPSYNTSRDMQLGKILAYTRFQEYVQEQLQMLSQAPKAASRSSGLPSVVWRETKSSFIELVYAIFLSGATDADIKTLVQVLGSAFNVKVKNEYDVFQHVKNRKLEPAKYINKMKTCLLKKYSEDSTPPHM